MVIYLISAYIILRLCFYEVCVSGCLTTQAHVLTTSSWSGILVLSIGWRQTLGRIYAKKQLDYGDQQGYNNPVGYNGPLKRWEKYDDEVIDYPRYDSQPINWIRSKYFKMKNNKSIRPEILPRNRKHSQLDHSEAYQPSTAIQLVETKTPEDKNNYVTEVMKTTTKQLLNAAEVTHKNPLPKTTSNSRRRTFTQFQTLRGMVVKKTIYEEILEDQQNESLASYATMAFLLFIILLLAILFFLGSRNKMKYKMCGRKLQNRRHTLLEVVASARLMGSSGNRESDLMKGAHKDSNSSKDLRRMSRKKKVQDPSEEKRLVAADDSEEEISLLVPVSKVKDFHHTEA